MANIGHVEDRIENSNSEKMALPPLVRVIIKICKKHLVPKSNSNINTYAET